jgi:hypothetical protein
VLVEKDGKGHAENFAPVTLRRPSEGWGPCGVSMDASLRWHDEVWDPTSLSTSLRA